MLMICLNKNSLKIEAMINVGCNYYLPGAFGADALFSDF